MKKIIALLLLSLSEFLTFAQSSYWRDKVTNNKIHIFIEDKKCMVEYDNGLKTVLCDNSYYESAYKNQFQVFDRDKEFELLLDEGDKANKAEELPNKGNVLIIGNYSLSIEPLYVTLQNLHDGKSIAWSFKEEVEAEGSKKAQECFIKAKEWMEKHEKDIVEFDVKFAKSIYRTPNMKYEASTDIIRVESKPYK